MPFTHVPKPKKKLQENYNRRLRKGVNGFDSLDDFINWYEEQDLICNYCGLSEIEMQEISMTSILSSKRFPQDGVIGRGTNRAVWLEVDRIDSNGVYSSENCVLCCYFCNYDKNDVFPGNEYLNFFQNRVEYLRELLERNRQCE